MAGEEDTHREALVGRRRELAVLDRLVADVAAGSSRVLVLRGEAGTGKTALLGSLAARVPGWRVVSAGGVESETDLVHGVLHQLCAPLLDGLAAVPAPQRDALATVLGLRSGPAPDRLLVALATLSLVAEAAERGPLACLVDDVQWSDRASAQVLSFVARRLPAGRVALVCAARAGSGDDVLPGLPALTVRGLSLADARLLLLRELHVALDPAVTDRVVSESRGNPSVLLEFTRSTTATALAGGFDVPVTGPAPGRIERGSVERLGLLPADARSLVLTAAAEPSGDPSLLHRAVEVLGMDPTATGPALDAGLLQVGRRVQFAHPLARAAVYRAAAASERRRVHAALAEATDAGTAPDRRAWHRARAVPGPDEQVAAELERTAGRARARGGLAAAAAFLTRAADLTPDPGTRVRRALDAAAESVRAGALDTALSLLVVVEAGPADEVQHARADLVRARLALVSRRADQAAPLLLSAARRLEAPEPDLARAAHLDASAAARSAARLGDGVVLADLATALRGVAPRPDGEPTAEDLLLTAVTALSADRAAAVPAGRQALARLRRDTGSTGDRARRLWHGGVLALELWDDDAAHALLDEHLRTVRGDGALGELPLALGSLVPVLVLCGELPAAAALVEEARSASEALGIAGATSAEATHEAWRGRERPTLDLVEVVAREARSRGDGMELAACARARAVLFNALGRYEEALGAALVACAEPRELVVHNWALTELVEAAAGAGRVDLAADALRRLTARTGPSGTDWARGVESRARALLGGADAEDAFRRAIEHLGRTRVRAELARTHLLFGEWLQRDDRRTEARDELGAAYEMSGAMGLGGFEERSRRALVTTGTGAGTPRGDARDDLTAQEARIAGLARDGLSNPEIGARLFLSARTVEWHLRKVFAKLGITTRRELRRAMADREDRRPGPRP